MFTIDDSVLPKPEARDIPSAAVHQAVLVDFVNLGPKPDLYNPGKTKMVAAFRWQINETNPATGRRFLVDQWVNLSWGTEEGIPDAKPSTMRIIFSRAFGKKLTDNDTKSPFNPAPAIGWNALVEIKHVTKKNNVYERVGTVTPLPKGMESIKAEDYDVNNPPRSKSEELLDAVGF